MGKCLSCCEDPNLSASAGLAKSTDGERATDLSKANRTGCVQDSRLPGETVSNGNNKISSSTGQSTEKRMFYSRIPPILSGSGDSKRSSQSKGDISEAKINALFDLYRDADEDTILSEGIERFCHDLDVKPEEFKVLVIAWKFGAETMCKFTRQEFMNGCKLIKVDSIKGMQGKFPELLQEVKDPEKFKDLYRFTFKFGIDSEAGQRILPCDMAIGLWKLVYSQRDLPILNRWLSFLEKHPNVRGIPRDTWNMFQNFIDIVGDDLSTYDDTEAWPSLFDDFVEHENDQTNQNTCFQHRERRDDD